MPTPTFKRISSEQFGQLLAKFPFTRKINAVHMHHTWRPNRSDFNGHETIVSMWRYHTQELGWRDIAQHITIDPEGFIWLGRNWNLAPASAAGHNGNAKFGPFMFEMIGNFDRGHDALDGEQRETALQVIAMVQARFGLASNTLQFHNALSSKSCPGNSLDYARIVAEVDKWREALQSRAQATRDIGADPFPDEPDIHLTAAIEALQRTSASVSEPADAELTHRELGTALEEAIEAQSSRSIARDVKASPAMLAALRPHLVNLSMGRFSDEGQLATSPSDVDAIFEQHLPKALAEAKAEGRNLQLLFYAHGGLVSESAGLQIAAKHIDWWKQNGVYPLYFIWETGLFETLGSLLKRAQQGTTRGLPRDLWDYTLDPLTEIAARALQGPRIWGGMKSSAEHAADKPSDGNPTGGGAWYVAKKLKEFCDAHEGSVELHAIGHSAGAIFHSYFLRAAHEIRVPAFASAHFLAPAVRVDTFKELIGRQIGDGKVAKKLAIFTMKKDLEKADNCAGIYHKSLLYLIFHALEDARSTPILGLEESLRDDADLKKWFGLGEAPAAALRHEGEVVWSITASDTGASASASRSHGGFDDDAPTMNSLARRILNKADADPIVEYGSARDITFATGAWTDEVDWPESLGLPSWPAVTAAPSLSAPGVAPWIASPVPAVPLPLLSESRPGSERRHALCIGINRYPNPDHQLAGCVADAQMWAGTLQQLGFTTSVLLDHQATRETIAKELLALVNRSQAGDVIVFQYSGHGTMLPDLNGDEEDGMDEAICPVDFTSGALYIDDDIAQVIEQLPDGVNFTFFMDCCHSGTNSRFAAGVPTSTPRAGRDERKRYVLATPEIVEAHKRFRQKIGGTQRARGTGGRSLMRDIKFAACLDSEVAWESDGHGEFTLRATRILATGIDGLTNEQFMRKLTADFGMGTRQHPLLDCAPASGSRQFLHPLLGNGATTAATATATPPGVDNNALLAQTLASLQKLVAQLAAQ